MPDLLAQLRLTLRCRKDGVEKLPRVYRLTGGAPPQPADL